MKGPVFRVLWGLFFLTLAACGGGGGGGTGGGPTAPDAPASLQATAGDGEVTLSWTASTNATGYTLYWNTTGSVTTSDAQVDVGLVTTYPHGGLANGSTYYYRIAANNDAGSSGLSTEASATPSAPVAAPSFDFYHVQPANTKLRAATWHSDHWVAIGNKLVATSTDGIRWTVTNTTIEGLEDIVSVGSRLVAVGSDISTSDDGGVSWTARTFSGPMDLKAVGQTTNRLVAVSEYGFFYSTDLGQTWNSGGSIPYYSTSAVIDMVVIGDEIIVVDGNRVYQSLDEGDTWGGPYTPGAEGIAWNGSQLLLTKRESGSTVYSSTDSGATWSEVFSGVLVGAASDAPDPVWTGSQWLMAFEAATATGPNSTRIYTSNDGVTWSLAAQLPNLYLPLAAWSGSQALLMGDGIASSSDLSNWSWHILGGPNGSVTNIAMAGDRLFMPTDWNSIYSSTDGLNWNIGTFGATDWVNDITFGNSLYVAVGDAGTTLTSPDGQTWTSHSSGTGEDLYKVIWNGSLFVAVGDAGTLLTSGDGSSWTNLSASISTTYPLISAVWMDSQFVVVGGQNDGSPILTSDDGITWNESQLDSTLAYRFYDVVWTGTQLVAIGSGSDPAVSVFISTDGTSWTSYEPGNTDWLYALAGAQDIVWTGEYLAFVNESTLYTSADGVTWTEHNLPYGGDTSGASFRDIAWTGERLVMVSPVGNEIIVAEEQ